MDLNNDKMTSLIKYLLMLSMVFNQLITIAQTNWVSSNNGLPVNSFVNAFAQLPNGDIYTIINAATQGYLYKSTDGGNSWSNVTTNGLPTGAWAGSFYENNGIMFIGSGGLGNYLYKSSDNGLNWTSANAGLPPNSYVNDFAQVANGDIYTILNASAQGYLYKSTDNGNSWSNVTTNGLPTGAWAGSFYENNSNMFIGSGGLGNYLYKSPDNGLNWTSANTGLPSNSYVNDFAQIANGDVYTIINAGAQGYMYKSTDNGNSWSNVTTNGLPTGAWAGSFYENNGIMLIGSGGLSSYLYKSGSSTSGLPDYDSLKISVYPVPSNGIINLISHTIITTLIVTDINGIVVLESFPNSTSSKIEIMYPGIYFVHAISEKASYVRKITIE